MPTVTVVVALLGTAYKMGLRVMSNTRVIKFEIPLAIRQSNVLGI